MNTAEPHLGVVALDTRFPRVRGDGGNAASYPFRTTVRVVRGASIEQAVWRDPLALLEPFVAGSEALVREGATAVVTTCGFLVPLQHALQSRLPVPVGTSALIEVPRVQSALGRGKRVGIMTIAASALRPAHLRAAGVRDGTPIATMEGTGFAASILGNCETLDVEEARAEHVAVARAFHGAHPDLGAIVLECANMPPYADAIGEATGLPVYSILTLAKRLVNAAHRP